VWACTYVGASGDGRCTLPAVSTEPLLYELHDRARGAGVGGYRLMTKAALIEALDGVPPGPTIVESSVRGGLGLITFRGGRENALSLETLEQLSETAEALAADESVRLVALRGGGTRIFSSGADLPALEGLDGAAVAGRGAAALERLATLGVPTIALLNGHAVGGGIDLALACDWRVAVESAKLRFIHNELGYSPPWGAAARLRELVPRGVALRLFAACELLSAHEARTLGIVDEVVVAHKLLSRAESLAVRIGRSDRAALAHTKRLLGPDTDLDEHSRTFAALWDAKAATLSA
jgi:enoyl-CoA hydratase/carnithine racemase